MPIAHVLHTSYAQTYICVLATGLSSLHYLVHPSGSAPMLHMTITYMGPLRQHPTVVHTLCHPSSIGERWSLILSQRCIWIEPEISGFRTVYLTMWGNSTTQYMLELHWWMCYLLCPTLFLASSKKTIGSTILHNPLLLHNSGSFALFPPKFDLQTSIMTN